MNPSSPSAAGIVLAAGEGKRFGGPKAPYVHEGERLVDRAVRILREAGCDPVFVILGAWEGNVDNATVIVNHGWEEGMGSSLRTGLKWVNATTEAEYALITLVDLPGMTTSAMKRILDTSPGIAVGTFDGKRGHPVRIPREHFRELIDTVAGDTGAKPFMEGREDITFVELSDIADGHDLDIAPSAR